MNLIGHFAARHGRTVQTAIIGNLLRVTGAHDPQLLAVGGDDTKLFIPNLFVELDCVLFSADK